MCLRREAAAAYSPTRERGVKANKKLSREYGDRNDYYRCLTLSPCSRLDLVTTFTPCLRMGLHAFAAFAASEALRAQRFSLETYVNMYLKLFGKMRSMVKTSLGKKDLQKEKQRLKLYLKLLPSIDLKRTQLMAEQLKAKNEMAVLKKESEQIIADVAKTLPMLANRDVKLEGLVKIRSLVIEEQNVVGMKLPFLKEVLFEECDYSILATPSWIEAYIKQLKRAVEEKIRVQVMGIRVEKLNHAVRRITQHVNLFEKILIPTAKKNIQKIQIILGEAERNAVVRAKLAKALHAREEEADIFEETAL